MIVHNIVVDQPQKTARRNAEGGIAWSLRCHELARWTLDRMVVRPDAYGRYYRNAQGKVCTCKVDQVVDADLLGLHYASDTTSNLVGVFSTSLLDQCKLLRVDIDQHGSDRDETTRRNLAFAMSVVHELRSYGFQPLLSDSNGAGGFWLDVFFDRPVPATDVRAFGRWLVRQWQEQGLEHEPEVFPKQDSIEGGYGNFFRLYGRHHTRPWFTEVWCQTCWRPGDEAIDNIVSHHGDPFESVPAEALLYGKKTQAQAETAARPASHDWLKRYTGDLRSLDMVALCESKGWSVNRTGDRSFEIECPWADQHTSGNSTASIQAGDPAENLIPTFHCFHSHCEGRGLRELLDLFIPAEVNGHCGKSFGNRSGAKVEEDRPVITPDQPLQVARMFRDQRFSHGDDKTLVHYQGVWWRWIGRKYEETSEDDLRTAIYNWLDTCSYWTKPKKSDEPTRLPFHPTRSVVTGVGDALKAVTNVPSTIEIPCWIGSEGPGSIIAFKNGLLDLDAYRRTGRANLLHHSPRWFSTNCLPHDYDEKAGCPHWLVFLDQVFEGDQERKQALAMWFGYCLTSDTRQQKFALLVGPPRSGKGTAMAILGQILGQDNIASPSLTSMGSRFGLAPLIGKQAAIIGDGHLGRQSDSVAILERLKSIVGGDPQNIDRKGAAELANVQIKARFSISVNELPRLPDASAALRSRILLIPFNRTFEGKEDLGLLDRLRLEVPGITNWALAGLRQLRQTERLVQPKVGQDILDEFVRLSSPIQGFLEDCCHVEADCRVSSSDLQAAWRWWCDQNGHEVGSNATFGIRLRAAVPRVQRIRHRAGLDGKQHRYYEGIGLTKEAEDRVNSLNHGMYLVA